MPQNLISWDAPFADYEPSKWNFVKPKRGVRLFFGSITNLCLYLKEPGADHERDDPDGARLRAVPAVRHRELPAGVDAGGRASGAARETQRRVRQHRADLPVPQPLLPAGPGALREEPAARRQGLPQTRAFHSLFPCGSKGRITSSVIRWLLEKYTATRTCLDFMNELLCIFA